MSTNKTCVIFVNEGVDRKFVELRVVKNLEGSKDCIA